MPVRRLPPSRATNTRGRIASGKAIGPAIYESSLERDYLLLLDYDRDVQKFEVQPLRIDMSGVPGHRYYTPDVLITFAVGAGCPWLVEVKYEADLCANWATLRPKFKAAIRLCRSNRWAFRIMTERHIRTPLLDNIKFLRDYRTATPDIAIAGAVLAAAARGCRVGDIIASVGAATDETSLVIWHQLWHGRLYADLDQPLSTDTEVFLHAV